LDKVYGNILIFNPFGIGDVIFSTPLVKAIKNAYPASTVTYICNKRGCCVLEHNPKVDKIIIYEKDDFRKIAGRSRILFLREFVRFIKTVKAADADLMIDLSLNHQASLAAKLMGIKRRIGFNFRDRGKFLTEKIELDGFDDKHVILYYLDVLKLIGINTEGLYPEAFTSDEQDEWAGRFFKENRIVDKQVIGIVPGGGKSWGADARYRRWPIAHFAHTVDKIIDRFGVSVLLFGDRTERKICENMKRLMKNNVINTGGQTNIGQFMALAKRCKLILCNEGGPLHIAVALGTPTVSIFGPVDENVYGPYSEREDMNLIVRDRSKCRPCYSRFKHTKCALVECLNAISVDNVFAAVKTLLERLGINEKNITKTSR